MNLTHADVRQLLMEPSPRVRADLAAKIAEDFSRNEFADGEKTLAVEIFRLLLRDAEVLVRKTLAQHLQNASEVPRDIIMQLAQDMAEVAVPVLERSYALTEEDLVEIVNGTRVVAKLTAIARRETLSVPVSDALIDSRNDEVLKTLFDNRGANLSAEKLAGMLDYFDERENLLEALVQRGGLSLSFVDRLFTRVSDTLKKQLQLQYKLNFKVAGDGVESAREWATLNLINAGTGKTDVEALVEQLYRTRRLTHSIIIRSLCLGDLQFFETAMSKLAGVPLSNGRLLLLDPGPLGFRALYQATSMPVGFYEAVRILYEFAQQETSFGHIQRDDFYKRIIDRITAAGYDKTVENMQYLMAIIKGRDVDVATVH